jgi:aspartate 1-decarboxylase
MRMNRFMLKSKIHRATVTHANVDYEGSLTVDSDLLRAADILPYEEIHVWNVTRGTRWRTYAIAGDAASGVICVNGAGAHLVKPGERIIIASFTVLEAAAAAKHKPRIISVDARNRIRPHQAAEAPGPRKRKRA